MSKNYLTEAFKELDLLESQSFDVDKKGTSELEDFLEDDSLDDFEVVIDPEAETEEDLQKSYMGKVILTCDVCHSMIYKDPAEVVVDEESQLANVGELCPYCFTGDGYKVVGKVAPYEEVTVEAEKPVEVKVDGEKVEVEDKIDEALNSTSDSDLEKYRKSLVRYIGSRINAIVPNRKDYVRASDGHSDYEYWFWDTADYEEVLKIFKDLGLVTSDTSSNWDVYTYRGEDGKGGRIEIWDMPKVAKKLMDKEFKIPNLKELKKSPVMESFEDWEVGDEVEVTSDTLTSKMDSEIFKLFQEFDGAVYLDTFSDTVRDELGIDVSLDEDYTDFYINWAKKHNLNADDTWIYKDEEDIEKYLNDLGYSRDEDDDLDEEIQQDQKFPVEHKKAPVMEDLDFTDEAEIRKQLAKYSGQYLTITFKGSEDWKHISDLLDESINSDEEEDEESALDELESSYRKEYDLLKSLEVDEISEITSYTSYVVVTIKVKKDDLQHNFSDHYSDLINMPSINKDTIKILELELNESLKRRYKKFSLKEDKSKKLKESMDDISITTEDQVIKIKSTPREDKETIQPVTETEVEKAKEAEEDTSVEEVKTQEEIVEEPEEIDVDLDEIDEEGMDDLGESYLKSVYENVNGFKTSKATLQGNKMILEGVISFTSGNKAKTKFIFESKEATKRGKLKFLGENKNISKNKKAFTLIGSLNNKKLMLESLNYNYTGKDSKTGKTKRLYGTIRRKSK